MELLLDVVSVMPQKDCTLLLTFENNERRIFDMAPYLERKPYLKLKNVPLFVFGDRINASGDRKNVSQDTMNRITGCKVR